MLLEDAYRRRPALPWRVLSLLLAPFGWLYALLMRGRARAYERGWLRSARPSCRVVSVGNLTMGGSGKTPVTAFIAESLAASGQRTVVVSRGYRGQFEGQVAVVSDGAKLLLDARQAGDEPVMLARRLPSIPVVVGARRAEAVALATDRFAAQAVVCDDAFSHLAMQRDVDLVLVHGRDGLGNRRCTPAGPLREPPAALRRAAAVLLNATAGEDPATLDDLRAAGWTGPVFRFHYAAPVLRRAVSGQPLDPVGLADRRVVAFAGVARPQDFFASLARAGWLVAASQAFPDHHSYTSADLTRLAQLAAEQGICYLAATAKDAVKLPPDLPSAAELLIAGAELAWEGDDDRMLMALVESRLGPAGAG